MPEPLRGVLGVCTLLWVLFWVLSGLSVGGVLGDSIPQLLFFLGMAFLPPALIYLSVFRLFPWFLRRIKKSTGL